MSPSFPLEDDREPRIRRIPYGDGYTSRVRDGINHQPGKETWEWENLTFAEYMAIWEFFAERGGDQAFLYAVPWGSSTYWYNILASFQMDATVTSYNLSFGTATSSGSTAASGAGGNSKGDLLLYNPSLKQAGAQQLTEQYDLTDAAWVPVRCTLSKATGILDPLGNNRAYKLVEDGASGVTHSLSDNAISKAASILQYDLSIWARAGGRTRMWVGPAKTGHSDYAFFDLTGAGSYLGALLTGTAITLVGTPTITLQTSRSRKWIAPKYRRKRNSAGFYDISVDVEEVFEA